jgi:hypothetical protein
MVGCCYVQVMASLEEYDKVHPVSRYPEAQASISVVVRAVDRRVEREIKAGEREYSQMLIYLPREVVSDSQFFLVPNSACEIVVEVKNRELIIRQIDEQEARKRGWVKKDNAKRAK